MSSIPLTSVQKLGNIWLSQKCAIFGFHRCCPKMKDIQDSQIFVVRPDRVTTNDRLGPNFVFVTLNFEILDFFQDPHFFPKK